MAITIGGTFSGLNVSSIISAIIAADSVPITNLQSQDTTLSNTSSDLGSLGSSLGNLSAALQSLGAPGLFSTQTATGSNSSVGTASVSTGATPGSFSINVTQVATNTILQSGTATNSKLTVPPAGTASLASVLNETSISGQTFTINGKQITLGSSTVLDDGNPNSTNSVVGLINNSGAGVTASYDSSTGDFSLVSSTTPASTVILGAATDTSDFLQQAQLFNNASSSVTSTTGIGRIDPNSDLSAATNLAAPLTTGTYSINGVSLTYTAGESLNNVLGDINSSNAGVTAVYDSYADQIDLTSTTRGPQNITVSDGSSNFATAMRLTSSDSELQEGKPTTFTLGNSSTVRQSDSSTLTSSDLNEPGVTFNATGTGTTLVTVAPDVTTIAAALNSFVSQYNSTQNIISTYTTENTSNPSASGSLASDPNLVFIASQLRQITSGATNNTSTIRMLSDLGIDTNANNNTLTDVDTTKLQAALTNNPSEVNALFNDPTNGLTNTVQSVLDQYNNSLNGVIVDEQNQIKSQISYNQNRITTMNEQIAAEQTRLQEEFAALDSIEANNSSLSGVLNGTSSSSTSSSSSSSSSTSSIGSVGSTSSAAA